MASLKAAGTFSFDPASKPAAGPAESLKRLMKTALVPSQVRMVGWLRRLAHGGDAEVYAGSSEAQILDVHAVTFGASTVDAADGFAHIHIDADPTSNPGLDLEHMRYVVVRGVFSVKAPGARTNAGVLGIRLAARVDAPNVNVRSFFPSTEAASLATETTSFEVSLESDLSMRAKASAKVPGAGGEAEHARKTKAAAGVRREWRQQLVGHPVVARRTATGVEWELHSFKRLAQGEKSAKSLRLGGSDVEWLMVVGIPKEEVELRLRLSYEIEAPMFLEGTYSIPATLDLAANLPRESS